MNPLSAYDIFRMRLFPVDNEDLLFVSAEIIDWQPITERQVKLVIDLEEQLDIGIPTIPNSLIYVYFPFADRGLPDLFKLHTLGRLAADMVRHQRSVLIHCSMGLNRSPLLAGVTLTYLGMSGPEALALIRAKREGALYNQVFANYLAALTPHPALPSFVGGSSTPEITHGNLADQR